MICTGQSIYVPDGKEVTDAHVHQYHDTATSETLYHSSGNEHGSVRAHAADNAPCQEDEISSQYHILPPKDVGELAPERNRSGVGQQICRTNPRVQVIVNLE